MSERLSEIRDWAERMMKVPPGHYDSEHQLASDCLYLLTELEEARRLLGSFVQGREYGMLYDARGEELDAEARRFLAQPAVALDAAASQEIVDCETGNLE